MPQRLRFLTAALALVFLAVHAWLLPRSLEDIDTINLALGVEHFDVLQHRPHPPGYPVFIALGKISTAALGAIAPGWNRTERAAVGLAIWGVIAGALSAWVFVGFWSALRWPSLSAWFGAMLAIVSPIFWFTSARPLTDVTALVAAVAVQCVVLRAWRGGPSGGDYQSRWLVAAAVCAGLLIGLRTQTMWLTGPLLAWSTVLRILRRDWSTAAAVSAASIAGVLAWAVPLVWITGGLDAYVSALAFQGQDDFRGVSMLATSPDLGVLRTRLVSTFILPWRVVWLGELVVSLAAVGVIGLLRHDRRALVILLVAFLPYVTFHLLFQDVDTVRYALPVVVPIAGLAARALWMLPMRVAIGCSAVVATASLVVAHGALRQYNKDVPPTFLAFHDAEVKVGEATDQPLVLAQDGMRRVADWFRPEWPTLPVLLPHDRTWLRIVEHFRTGASDRAWFMTDRRRAGALLFDHRSRTVVKEYLRDPAVRQFIGQTRQDEVRWWEIVEPGWMLGQGWALSPDAGAVTFADGREPHQVPAQGYLRRSAVAHRLMIGGRYLAGPGDGVLVLEIDGRPLGRWPVLEREPWFLHWADVPPDRLIGPGAYAAMTVRVEPTDGASSRPRIELAQFDFAPSDVVVAGLSTGWYEAEANPDTGQSWRWSSDSSAIDVRAGEAGARLFLAGESTLRYFTRPSLVAVKVNGALVKQFEAGGDFSETVELPATVLSASPAIVTIETDQIFVPAERGESADRRRLGLRLSRADVRPLR